MTWMRCWPPWTAGKSRSPHRSVTLATEGAQLHTVTSDWRHDLLEIIADPTIAYGLLIFGVYGLILEFYNPGMIFPSVIGVLCLLLGAYGLQLLPINYAGLALIVVGLGMMIGEAFAPTMGIMGVTGLIAFVIGSIILIDTETPGYTLPLWAVGAFAATSALLAVLAVGAAVRARVQTVRTGRQGMIGGAAEALDDFAGQGRVRAFGEVWRARSSVPVTRGDRLRVVGIDELVLEVEPADAPATQQQE